MEVKSTNLQEVAVPGPSVSGLAGTGHEFIIGNEIYGKKAGENRKTRVTIGLGVLYNGATERRAAQDPAWSLCPAPEFPDDAEIPAKEIVAWAGQRNRARDRIHDRVQKKIELRIRRHDRFEDRKGIR